MEEMFYFNIFICYLFESSIAGKINIEHVTIFLSKYISKGAVDLKFSPDVFDTYFTRCMSLLVLCIMLRQYWTLILIYVNAIIPIKYFKIEIKNWFTDEKFMNCVLHRASELTCPSNLHVTVASTTHIPSSCSTPPTFPSSCSLLWSLTCTSFLRCSPPASVEISWSTYWGLGL